MSDINFRKGKKRKIAYVNDVQTAFIPPLKYVKQYAISKVYSIANSTRIWVI